MWTVTEMCPNSEIAPVYPPLAEAPPITLFERAPQRYNTKAKMNFQYSCRFVLDTENVYHSKTFNALYYSPTAVLG